MDDWNAGFAVAMIVISGALIVGAEIAWRRLSRASPDLPMWRFLRRIGIRPAQAADAVGAKALQQSEIACTICGSREECLKRLGARGAVAPPDNCPNARLFGQFGLRTDQTRR
jgi:hypothetical protein